MSNIVKVDFGNRSNQALYSADVYSGDMKKYQFQVMSFSTLDALNQCFSGAEKLGVYMIKCVAIYQGAVESREGDQAPVRVWYQNHQAVDRCV